MRGRIVVGAARVGESFPKRRGLACRTLTSLEQVAHNIRPNDNTKSLLRPLSPISSSVPNPWDTCRRESFDLQNKPCHCLIQCRKASTKNQQKPKAQVQQGLHPHHAINPKLAPYMCPDGNDKHMLNSSGFSVFFLGTSAGMPTNLRSNASTALRTQNSTFLFDAGEGAQRQLNISRISIANIDKIFITHMHGDHIFGLPGLLLALQSTIVGDQTKTVEIYGPVGLYNFIASAISLANGTIRKLQVYVYELHGGKLRRRRHPAGSRHYPEFGHTGLVRKAISQNKDGTWTLCRAPEVTSPELVGVADRHYKRGFHITAAELDHVPKLSCFGFVVEEPRTLPRNIYKDRAVALGLEPGDKYELLKLGFPVENDDGSRIIQPDEVLVEGLVRPRKLVFLGDCCRVPGPMERLSRNADVLIHEATFSESDTGARVEFGGHSSAADAGRFANRVNPSVLFLNHISSSANSPKAVRDLEQEAEKQIRSKQTFVQAACDLMEIHVPRSGFPFSVPKDKTKGSASDSSDDDTKEELA